MDIKDIYNRHESHSSWKVGVQEDVDRVIYEEWTPAATNEYLSQVVDKEVSPMLFEFMDGVTFIEPGVVDENSNGVQYFIDLNLESVQSYLGKDEESPYQTFLLAYVSLFKEFLNEV